MKRKAARGRGNQGDWINNRARCGVVPEHTAHNNQVDAKNRARKARRILKAMEIVAGES